ncbi:hypothetical protein [Botrimarina sp.]|uniref:hypothetical protein n=1 Tax=Botrimarina sp. TaxID=2795802 RepID=UPI0032EB3CA0
MANKHSERESARDAPARLGALVAFIVSLAALYIAWSTSPLYHAPPTALDASVVYASRRINDGERLSLATLQIQNTSSRPARFISGEIVADGRDARLSLSRPGTIHRVVDGFDTRFYFEVSRLSGGDMLDITLEFDPKPYEERFVRLGGNEEDVMIGWPAFQNVVCSRGVIGVDQLGESRVGAPVPATVPPAKGVD